MERRFFVDQRDLPRARRLLEREGVTYEVRRWQREIWVVIVPDDADVSKVFA